MPASILKTFFSNQKLAAGRTATQLGRYGVAVVSVALALAAALLLRRYGLPHPFLSFSFAAIAITFWYEGTVPGLGASVLLYSALTYFFTPAKIGGLSWDSYLIIYAVFTFFVGWSRSSRRRAERLLTEARDHLEIRVAERTAELTTTNTELRHTQGQLAALTQKLAQEKLYLEDEIRTDANFEEVVGNSAEL